jgi:TctA family transporter
MTTKPDQQPHAWLQGRVMRAATDAGLGLALLCAGAAAIIAAGGMNLGSGPRLGSGFFPTIIGWLLVAVGIAVLLRAVLLRNKDDARWSLTSVAIITAAVLSAGFAARQWGENFVLNFNFALNFGPSEFVTFMVFGLAVAIALARASRLRAAGMVLLGLLIATVGLDLQTGIERFTMGLDSLADGISDVTVLLGFAAADGALCAASPLLLLASYARKVGRRLAGKPSLLVSLLLRVAGLLVVAAAFFADYVFEGTGSPTGQIAVFAVFGIACQLLGWNRLVLLMALGLGPLLEENIRRALLLSNGDLSTFLRWPISGTLSLLAAAVLTVAVVLSACRALPRRQPA